MEVQEHIREVSCATILKLEDDFLKVTVNSGAAIDITQIDEMSAAYSYLMGPVKPFYMLSILPDDLNPSKEIREYWRKPERSQRKLAEAIVINGIAMAIIAKFVSKFEKPRHRMAYFRTEAEAMLWLEQVRDGDSLKTG